MAFLRFLSVFLWFCVVFLRFCMYAAGEAWGGQMCDITYLLVPASPVPNKPRQARESPAHTHIHRGGTLPPQGGVGAGTAPRGAIMN